MIQDIAPSTMDIHYEEREVSDDAVAMAFYEDRLLSRFDGEIIAYPTYRELCRTKDGTVDHPEATFLFRVDGQEFFLVKGPAEAPEGYVYRTMRELRALNTEHVTELFEAFTAYHLHTWYESSRYCGRCGGVMTHDTTERAMFCPACKTKVYPRINPAVIVGIRNGEKILVTRYRTGYAHSALVAGFAEIGETLEDTVRREVMEEVGLRVKNITYYKSQPWGTAADLLAGFFCEVDGSDEIRMDEQELKYAEWVGRDEIQLQPNNYSLTNEMMKLFQSGK